jgi:membrane protein required for beta-lactamase induction
VILAALLPGLVVAAASRVLGAVTHGAVYVLLAAAVVSVALGPRDLRREVAEFRAAAAHGDAALDVWLAVIALPTLVDWPA